MGLAPPALMILPVILEDHYLNVIININFKFQVKSWRVIQILGNAQNVLQIVTVIKQLFQHKFVVMLLVKNVLMIQIASGIQIIN